MKQAEEHKQKVLEVVKRNGTLLKQRLDQVTFKIKEHDKKVTYVISFVYN